MIYTLTLNPAIDHIVRLEHLELGETNRIEKDLLKAGGKGINVSILLKNLGLESTVMGFVGGFTGEELEKTVIKDYGLACEFIHVENGLTRINVKLKSDTETEINGPGLPIQNQEINNLFRKIEKIKDGDYLFLSGSIPKALEENFYARIMEKLENKSVKIIVDTSGKALEKTLKYKPFLIKPNLRELEGLFGVKIENHKEIAQYCQKLQKLGARNIIVSLGAQGAYMLDEEEKDYYYKSPAGKLLDSVGAGDSMVAGYIYAIEQGFNRQEAFKFSIACGSATAYSEEIGTRDEIYKLYKMLK